MNICADHHDEIVFEGKNCPLCALKMEMDELLAKVADLENEIADYSKANP